MKNETAIIKEIKKKCNGGFGSFKGNIYQSFVATKFVYDMIDQGNIEYVIHQAYSYIDDILVKYKDGNIEHYQCKISNDNVNEILNDFLKEYFSSNKTDIKLILFSQHEYKTLRELKDSFNEYFTGSYYKNRYKSFMGYLDLKNKNIKTLCENIASLYKKTNLSFGENNKSIKKENILEEDLKDLFNIIEIKTLDINSMLEGKSKQIFALIHFYICYEGYGIEVNKVKIENLFKDLGLKLNLGSKNIELSKISNSILNKRIKGDKFYEKLKILYKSLSGNIDQNFWNEIKGDIISIRHFLHNQKDDLLFDEIKTNLIPVIIADKNFEDKDVDGNNKRKLIEYFDKHGKDHADEVVVILLEMYQKSRTPNLKRKIALSLENLGELNSIDQLFQLAKLITQENDAMIREFGIRSLTKFADKFSREQNNELLHNMFYTPVEEKDIVQGSATMAIKFQAKDLADASFRGSAEYLGLVLQNSESTKDVLPIFMEIYDKFLSKETYGQKEGSKIKEHSTWWMEKEDLNIERRKYESNPKKRLALELWHSLNELESKDPEIFKTACKYLIETSEYIGYFEILLRVLKDKDYPEITEKIVMNSDLIVVLDLDKERRYNLFNNYLSTHQAKISQYVAKVDSIKIENNIELETHIKAEAYFVIPQPRPAKIQKYIQEYEKKIAKEHSLSGWKMKVKEDDDFKITTSWAEDKSIDLVRFEQERSTKELVGKLLEVQKIDSMYYYDRDVFKKYSDYFINHSDQLKEFYETIKNNNPELIKNWFTGSLAEGQIKKYKKEYEETKDKTIFYGNIINLNDIFFDAIDAKQVIAKALDENEFLREKDTGELKQKNPELFAKIKKLILDYAQDKDPDIKEQENQNSYVELNSVRGVSVRLLTILAHYYPEEKDIYDQLEKLSDDDFIDIKASVIENLIYLITKDYPFCENIISKFEDSKEERINLALIQYMFRLGNQKLEAKKDLIKKIATNTQEEVQSKLGDLISQAFIHQVKLDDIVDDMISGKFGTTDMVEKFALQLENLIPKILSIPEGKIEISKALEFYKKLLKEYKSEDDQKNWAIKDRLSFLFYDDSLNPKFFGIFDTNGVFDDFIEYGPANTQTQLNKYLLKCVENNEKLFNRILLLLKKQVDKYKNILFSESYLCEEIIKILKIVLEKKGRNDLLDEIFDEGLKYGVEGFYEIFNKWYKE